MQCDGMHLFLGSVIVSVVIAAACGLSMLLRPIKLHAGCPLPVKARGLRFVPNIWHLSTRGADFIHQCRCQYGDTFVIDLIFRRFTFAFHPKALVKILSSSDDVVAFRPAVEDFTQRVFQLPSSQFFPQHHRLLVSLRGLLTPKNNCDHAVILLEQYRRHVVEHLKSPQQVDLMPFIKSYVFPAAVTALFGLRFWQRHMKHDLQEAFYQFEGNFELASSPVPHCLQPMFTRARARLLAALRASLDAGDFECTAVGELMRQCPMPDAVMPNMLLAVLWASLANTVPGTFWALAFLLLPRHAAHLAAVQVSLSSDLLSEHARPACDGTKKLLQVACDPGTLLASCVAEALRLRAPGLDVRMAAADLVVPSAGPWGHGEYMVRIPHGAVVAWSPYEMHLDVRVFGPGAARYDPCRPGMVGISGVPGVGGAAGLAFGGGKYRCPGRHFAGVEMALAIAVLLHTHDLELVQTAPVHAPGYPGDDCGLLPAPELRRQVGIRWPKSSCLVSIRPKA